MQERILAYANAGHTRPLFFRASSGEIEQLDADGVLLGVVKEQEFEERCCSFAAGDILLLHTDGLVDAENDSGEFFGTERLSNLLAALRNFEPEDILAAIFNELASFTENSSQSDDVSLVVIKIDT
jgi:serine phosphatase RsbU (regulator of sigma subunit)